MAIHYSKRREEEENRVGLLNADFSHFCADILSLCS